MKSIAKPGRLPAPRSLGEVGSYGPLCISQLSEKKRNYHKEKMHLCQRAALQLV